MSLRTRILKKLDEYSTCPKCGHSEEQDDCFCTDADCTCSLTGHSA